MKGLVSVIIPVYNVEKYLKQCLDSVINQTYRNLEIILVDDGSPDNSGKICDEYALKDNRIKVIHKQNGGLSSARNSGIDIATGEYILFIDSDDYISLNGCQKLYTAASKYNCDIVRGNIIKIYFNNKKSPYKQLPIFKEPVTGLDFITICRKKNSMLNMSVLALYKTKFIKDNKLYFYPGIYHEDVLWTSKAYLYAQRTYSISDYFYYYFERENSIISRGWNKKHKEDVIFICKKLYPAFKNLSFKYRKVLLNYLCGFYLNAINLSKDKNADRIFPLKTAYSIRNIIKGLIFFISPSLYFKLYRLVPKINKNNFYVLLRYFFIIILQTLFKILPINKKKVLCISYSGKGYGDDIKYVCNELIKNYQQIKIIWGLSGSHLLGLAPKQVKTVKIFSFLFCYHLATSKIWLFNSRVSSFFMKRKNQYYIQTWHGSPALKKIEADALNALSSFYVKSAKQDSKKADLFISNSKYWTKFIPKTFWYNGPILECGLPRLDKLYKSTIETKKDIKKKLNIKADKVLLYAPTFRKDKNIDCYSIDYKKLKKILEGKTGKTWHFCVRLHPNLVNAGINIPIMKGITDLSTYPDIYEIIEIFDLLITDYSSIMFDVGFYGTPVILFATDIEKYKTDRNFYFNLEELPFPMTTSNKELFEKIKTWDSNEYKTEVEKFKNKLGVIEDGKASKRIVEYLKFNRILD